MTVLGPTLLAFISSLGLGWLLAHPRFGPRILDRPNERSLHSRPVPRTGGVAILIGLGLAMVVRSPGEGLPDGWGWIALGVVLIGGVSFIDDCRSLPARWRFLVHLAAAGLFLYEGLSCRPLASPVAAGLFFFCLLGIVWMINLYNFMDGMDGLAAGMAVIGFSGLAILAAMSGVLSLVPVALVVAAAAGGFLVWNFPPARIFMGDSGSSSLGFLAAAATLWGQREGLPLLPALIVFSPFIADASWTLARRLWRGERVWEPHKQHAYQRLVESGWGHRRTVLAAYGLMVVCLLLALIASRLTFIVQGIVLAALSIGYAGLFVLLDRLTAPVERRSRQVLPGKP